VNIYFLKISKNVMLRPCVGVACLQEMTNVALASGLLIHEPAHIFITEGYHTVMIIDIFMCRRAKNLEGNIAKYTRDVDDVVYGSSFHGLIVTVIMS
jgi:hypothetical protein